jgi:SET domain
LVYVNLQLELVEYKDESAPKLPKNKSTSRSMNNVGREVDNEEKKETNFTNCDNVVDDEDSEMRGVHAKSHIAPHTICMSVPRRCLITVEMGQATPIGQAIMSSALDLDAPKHIFLMIYILWDRKVNGVKSFFYPYYEILPRTLKNMPIFWSPDELRHLEGSYLLNQIADRNAAVEDDYHSICQIAPLQKICTLEEFKWARMCVCSRNFGLQIDGHRTSALVPHADMLNHYRPRETKWTFDEEKQAFTITTLQFVQAGSEVFDSYGQKCNHRFLLNYGFAVEDNRELDGFCPNEVPVELYVSESDPLYNEKIEFWTRGEPSSQNASSSSLDNHPQHHPMRHQQQQQQQQQQNLQQNIGHTYLNPIPTSGSWHNTFYYHHQSDHPSSVSSVSTNSVKRVRLCVANNENTRLLFSYLRTLSCNEEELRAITSPASFTASPTSAHPATIDNSNPHRQQFHHYQYPGSEPTPRSLFGGGIPHARGTVPQSFHPHQYEHNFHHDVYRPYHTGNGSLTYHRSCRDIRHPIGIRNERESMRLLLQVVNRHLHGIHGYPTTLQEDCADLLDLHAYPRFSNRRHAKIQVKGEKEVLHHYGAWARSALEVLDIIEEEVRQELDALNTSRGMLSTTTSTTGAVTTAISNNAGVEVRLVESNSSSTGSSPGSLASSVRHRLSVDSNSVVSRYTRAIATASNMVQTAQPLSSTSRNNDIASQQQHRPSYDEKIRELEDDDNIHHTIVRYCADVLGSLRREEMKCIRRQQIQQRMQPGPISTGNNDSNNLGGGVGGNGISDFGGSSSPGSGRSGVGSAYNNSLIRHGYT